MKTRAHLVFFVAVLSLLLFGASVGVPTAQADGGAVRLRADDGKWIVTLFAPPNLARDREEELTVLVQDTSSGNVVMNAEVALRFTPPAGARLPLTDPWCRPPRSAILAGTNGSLDKLPAVRLTFAQSDNKLLQGASVIFPVAGDWQVNLLVRRGGEMLSRDGSLSVDPSSSRLAVIWPWLVMPPCLIGLFALNHHLRFRHHANA